MTRRFAPWLLALGMWTSLAQAQAQEAAPAAEESSGDPLYGYISMAFLAGAVLFAVGKSSRRS